MAEVNIKTRLSLRYDTLANWNSANPVLNKGEVAVVAIPSGATGESTYGQDTKPSILFKVGDGTSNFKALPYASARAADVYAWAKAANKPSYAATEISFTNGGNSDLESKTVSDALNELRNKDAGINQAITDLSGNVYTKSQTYTKTEIDKAIEDMAGEIQGALESDTNTKYQIVFDSTNGLIKLQSKDIGETSWKDISGQSFDLTTLTVAKAKGIAKTSARGTGSVYLPAVDSTGNFVAAISGWTSIGSGIEVTTSGQRDAMNTLKANISGNAATATSATSATVAEAAKKDNKGNIIDEHYATKDNVNQAIDDIEVGLANGSIEVYAAGRAAMDGNGQTITTTYATKSELNSHTQFVGPQISALQGHFTEGAANKAIADKNGNDIATTYATQAALGSVRDSLQNLEGVTQTLDGYFTSEGVALEAVEATKDGAGNVITSTYATKTELSTGLSGKADSSALSQQVTRLEGLIDDAVDEVTEIANGKTKTFITSKTNKDSSYNNSVFNTQNADITITPSSKILLIDGTNHLVVADLKLGDIILVKETDVPDRWVSAISSTSATLSKMETSKVDLTPYVLASTIINGKTLEDDIDLSGSDIGISKTNGTPIADKFSEIDEYIADFVSGDKAVAHAELADKAVQDDGGNVIKDTYATKAALSTLGTAFESVEWALFKLTADGQVSINTESSKINAKLNDYMSYMSTNDLKHAQIVERGLKFVMVDPTDVRWQGHISCFDVNRGILSIKFECDSLDTISPFNGYDITIAYKSGVVIDSVLERRFTPGDVYILNGGNAAGAYN